MSNSVFDFIKIVALLAFLFYWLVGGPAKNLDQHSAAVGSSLIKSNQNTENYYSGKTYTQTIILK